MQFKIGDKVGRIITDCSVTIQDKEVHFKVGQIGTIVGDGCCTGFYKVRLLNDVEMECNGQYLQLTETFTKSNLENGMVVEYENGQRRMVLGDCIVARDIRKELCCYNEDLIEPNYPSQTINKVYKTTPKNLNTVFNDYSLTLLWERKKQGVKRMTMAEIEEELGYKIEIISK